MSDINIKVILDGKETVTTLNEINSQIDELSNRASGLDKTSDEFKAITEEINKLKSALETGIVVNVDTKEANEKIDETSSKVQELGDTNIDIQVAANTTDATTNIETLNAEIRDSSNIEVDVIVNNSEANQSIDETTIKAEELNSTIVDINVEADTTEADSNIDNLNNSIDQINDSDVNVDVQVNSDTSEAVASIDDLNQSIDQIKAVSDIGINLNIQDNVEETQTNIDNLNTSIEGIQSEIDVQINSDTSEAIAGIEDLNSEISNIEVSDIGVNVDIQTDSEGVIASLNNSIDQIKGDSDIKVDVSIGADTSEATKSIEDLNKTIDGIQEVSDIKVGVDIVANDDSVTDILNSTAVEVDNLKSDLETPITINVDNEEANVKIEDTGVKATELGETNVDVNIDANTTDATTNIDNLNTSINEVQDDSTIKLDVNVDKAKIDGLIKDLKEGKKVGEELGDTDITPKVDPAPAEAIVKTTNSVASLRKELINLTAEFENSEVGSDKYKQLEKSISEVSVKLAVAKDRTEDLTDALRLNVGSGVERANNSFRLLGDGIKNLDFQKITTSLKGLGSVITGPFQDSFKQIGSNFKDLGASVKNLDFKSFTSSLGGVTKGFGALGKAVISTGIGALVIGVTSLIANFDELKQSGGVVGKVFTTIGEGVDALVDKFRPLLSFLGLAATEGEVKAEKLSKANEKEIASIEKRYDREVAVAQAAGKSTIALEREKATVLKEVADQEKKLLEDLQAAGENLSTDRKKRLDELRVASQDLGNQIEVLNAQQKKETDDATKEANEKYKEANQKRIEDQKKANETLLGLQDKYVSDGLKQIEGKYAKELKLIEENADVLRKSFVGDKEARKKNNEEIAEQEKILTAKVVAQREIEEEKFRQKEQDDRQKRNEENLKLQIDNEKEIALALAKSAEERIQIELAASSELFQVEENSIKLRAANDKIATQRVYEEKIKAAQVANEDITQLEIDRDAELKSIEEEATAASIKNTQVRNDAIISAAKSQTDIVNEEFKKQSDFIKSERDNILNDSIEGIGLFGRLDLLDSNLKKERDLLEKQKNDLVKIQQEIIDNPDSSPDQIANAQKEQLKLNEEFQTAQTDILKQGQEARNELINSEIDKRAEEASQLIGIISSIGSTNLESQNAQLEAEGQILDQRYQQSKEFIEANVKDEQARKAALSQLDADTQTARNVLQLKKIELDKKAIKQERNAILAQVLLASAQVVAKAAQAGSFAAAGGPVAFALGLAASLATGYAAIKKAKDALKAADAAANAVGASGGSTPNTGDNPNIPTPSNPDNASLVPDLNSPTGVNPTNLSGSSPDQIPQILRPVVSVIDIEARINSNRTSVSEATIEPG